MQSEFNYTVPKIQRDFSDANNKVVTSYLFSYEIKHNVRLTETSQERVFEAKINKGNRSSYFITLREIILDVDNANYI